MDNSIASYHIDTLQKSLQVEIENFTVCLTHFQLIELFITAKYNLSLGITNLYREENLD